jgi:uncharacterized damage-inducible protein DinB
MDDLILECLVQIRGLRETPQRLAALHRETPEASWGRRPAPEVWAPVEVVAHLADSELFFGVRLRLMLATERPALPRFDFGAALAARAGYLAWPAGAALERFRARREENLELLDACSAADLGRLGVHPERGPITVSDLVALMMAHDTEHAGQLRARLQGAP